MFTAMYQFFDEFQNAHHVNAKLGGFRKKEQAIQAIRRKSPTQSGYIQVGQTTVAVIKNGSELLA